MRSPRRWSRVRKKWVLATPFSPLTKRGMRTPKPLGKAGDDPEMVAQRIADYVRRRDRPCNVWVVDDSIYAVACFDSFNEAFRHHPRATLRGVVRTRSAE